MKMIDQIYPFIVRQNEIQFYVNQKKVEIMYIHASGECVCALKIETL